MWGQVLRKRAAGMRGEGENTRMSPSALSLPGACASPLGLCLWNGADVKQLELGKTKSKKEGKTVGDWDSRDCVVLLGHGWQWGARAALCPDSLRAESPRLPEFPFPLAVQQ